MPRKQPIVPLTDEQIQAAVARLDAPRELLRRLLIETGELAYGPRWQAPMAEALSAAAGRRVSIQSVNNWRIAQRGFPDALIDPLKAVGRQLTADARRRADRLKQIWDPDPHTSKLTPEEQRQVDEDCAALEEFEATYMKKED